jgi:hypothetical protein
MSMLDWDSDCPHRQEERIHHVGDIGTTRI